MSGLLGQEERSRVWSMCRCCFDIGSVHTVDSHRNAVFAAGISDTQTGCVCDCVVERLGRHSLPLVELRERFCSVDLRHLCKINDKKGQVDVFANTLTKRCALTVSGNCEGSLNTGKVSSFHGS